MTKLVRPLLFVFVAMSLLLAACGAPAATEAPVVEPTAAPAQPTAVPAEPTAVPVEDPLAMYAPDAVSGDIVTAGSSTVFPLSERMKQRFEEEGFGGNLRSTPSVLAQVLNASASPVKPTSPTPHVR